MKVAVESGLSPVESFLSEKGLQVETVTAGELSSMSSPSQYAAIVISGIDKDMLGIQDVTTACPVINAMGISPEEVFRRIQSETTLH